MPESHEEEEAVSGIACDMTGTITAYGKGAERLFGWKPEEVIGKEKVTIFHRKDAVATLVPRLLKTAAEQGKFEEEVTLVRKNGEEFRALLTVRPLIRDGQLVGYMGITRPLQAPEQAQLSTPKPRGASLWFKAFRTPFLQASFIPVLLGTVMAWLVRGAFDPSLFLLVLIGVSAFQVATNMLNDYFDFKSGADLVVKHHNPFAGGGRVLPLALIEPSVHQTVSHTFLALGAVVGLYLAAARGIEILLLTAVGAVCAYFYVAPPVKFAHRGVGELLVGLNFGPLVVLGTYFVQTQRFDLEPLLPAVPVGLLIAAVLWINELPDYEPDRSVGKYTLVARLGLGPAAQAYIAMVALAYVLQLLYVVTGMFSLTTLLPLLTLPLALRASSVLRVRYADPDGLIPANAATIMLHLAFGLLSVTGFALAALLPF